MNTHVHLFRHGEADRQVNEAGQVVIYGLDVRLNSTGRRQLIEQGGQFRRHGIRIDKIFASPIPRAWESALLFAEVYGFDPLRVVPVEDLQPIGHKGWVGRPIEEIEGPLGFAPHVWPGDEEPLAFYQRAHETLLTVVRENQGDRIAVFGHSDGIGAFMHRIRNPAATQPALEVSIPNGAAQHLEFTPEFTVIEKRLMVPYGFPRRGKEG